MNVLSLFDGMSCGQIALDQLGIPVDKYFAAEIDKHAIKVAKANYPDMVHLGDVREVRTKHGGLHAMNENGVGELYDIDLLIGGSPCQGFSFAGQQLNFDDPRSMLFFEYVRLLKALNPRYFLLENVKMKKESQDIISEYLGVEPIEINSNLVSAQNRKRLYWTNIPVDGLPEDKGIVLADILEPLEDIGQEHYHSMKAVQYMERGNDKWMQAGNRRADRYEQTPDTQKSFTLTANIHKGVPYNYFKDTRDAVKGARIVNRRLDENGKRKDNDKSIKPRARLELRKDDKAGCLTTVQKDSVVAKTNSSGLQIAGEADIKARESLRRVYDTEGKSPTLMASTGGHTQPKILQKGRGYNKGGLKAKDGKTPTISTSAWEHNNHLTYDEGMSWRKLTPTECERLQTVPDGYTDHVSNTQRYKMLGNGWTVEIIKHIMKGMM